MRRTGASVPSFIFIGSTAIFAPVIGSCFACAILSTRYFPAPSIALCTGKPSAPVSTESVSMPIPAIPLSSRSFATLS